MEIYVVLAISCIFALFAVFGTLLSREKRGKGDVHK